MLTSLMAGIILGLSAGFSPGPFMALVISHSLAHGAKEGIKVSLAPLVTDAPIIAAACLVLAKMANWHSLLRAVSVVGGLYLLYLARDSFRTVGLDGGSRDSEARSWRKGVLVNFLNPNPYLFWLTVGAPIITKGWGQGASSAIGFLLGFYVCLVGAKALIAVSVGRSRHLFGGNAYRWIMRGLGVSLAVFAGLLLWDAFARF